MDQLTDNAAQVKKKAIMYGVILGVISFVLSIVSLYISKSATSLITSSIASVFINYVIFLIIAVFMVINLRKINGGYLDFPSALKTIFIMLAITAAIGTIGIALFNVANPTLQEEAIDNTINLTIETLESTGAPDDQIDTTVEMLEQQKSALGSLSIGQILKGLMVSLLLYFVLSLILAAIFKKEKPIFNNPAPSDDAHPWQNENS